MTATAGGDDRVGILLVDDQPARLLSYGAILGNLGLDLVEARSGREALARLMEREFAAILLDVNMPDMDGFETAAMIHRHPRFEKTPIIFVTAVHVTDLDRLRGYELGAFDYVYVPVVPEILRNKVQVLAELHAQRKKLERLNRSLEQANVELAHANSSLQAERARELQALNRTLEKANLGLAEANAALEAENTERRRAEESGRLLNVSLLRRVEEVETLIDLVPVGIAIADDPRCDTVRVNRTFAELLQIPPQANASLTQPGPPGFALRRGGVDIPPAELPMHACVARGAPVDDAQIEIHRADGTARKVMIHARPLFDESNSVRGCIGVCVDLTERIRSEESLREADRRKNEFLATLSHELRNPLAAIANAAQFMQLASPAEPLLAPSLDVLGRQVGHLVRLVDDLLDVSRITRGKITLRTERIDLADVVGRALETARPLAARAPAAARGRAARSPAHRRRRPGPARPGGRQPARQRGQVHRRRRADRARGRLDRGGRRRARSGGRPRHRHRRRHRRGHAAEGVRSLRPGRPFARSPGGRPRHRARAGARDRAPARRHRRGVERRTRAGRAVRRAAAACRSARVGSGAARARPRPPRAPPPVRPRRVLLADDNLDSAESLAALLRILGHDVIAAYDGRGAIAAARLHRPDLILLDIGMPDMNGYDVARHLRAEPGLDATTLIALTGYGSEDDRRRSRAAGFDGHLVKPIDFDELERLLAVFGRGGRGRDAALGSGVDRRPAPPVPRCSSGAERSPGTSSPCRARCGARCSRRAARTGA